MTGQEWIEAEPGFVDLARHVLLKAWRRPLLTFGIAAALTSAIVWSRVRRPPSYVATAVIRMSEGMTTRVTPRPPGELRGHIATVSLNRSRVVELMRKYDMVRGREPTTHQIELFKDRIGIGVGANYFHDHVYADSTSGTRSAVITLEFGAGDADVAAGVVHDIATTFIETTEAARASRVAAARELYAEGLRQGRERIHEIETEQSRVGAGLGETRAAGARHVQIANLELQKAEFARRLESIEYQANELELALGAEKLGLGLSFDLVSEEVEAFGVPMGPQRLAVFIAVLFCVILPITAVVVGAFDRRVYLRDDLVHLGMPVLGVLPRFAGDDAGSLSSRRRV